MYNIMGYADISFVSNSNLSSLFVILVKNCFLFWIYRHGDVLVILGVNSCKKVLFFGLS